MLGTYLKYFSFIALLIFGNVRSISQDLKKLKKEELIQRVVLCDSKVDSLSVVLFESKNLLVLLNQKKWDAELQLSSFKSDLKDLKQANDDKIAIIQLSLDEKFKLITRLEDSLTLLSDSLKKINAIMSNSKVLKPLRYGGEYTLGNDIEKGAVGLLQIHPISISILLFNLTINRGDTPDESILLRGKIKLIGNIGVCLQDYGALNFIFGSNYVQVIGDDLMKIMGDGFSASGKYIKSTAEIPTSYIDLMGNSVSFMDGDIFYSEYLGPDYLVNSYGRHTFYRAQYDYEVGRLENNSLENYRVFSAANFNSLHNDYLTKTETFYDMMLLIKSEAFWNEQGLWVYGDIYNADFELVTENCFISLDDPWVSVENWPFDVT